MHHNLAIVMELLVSEDIDVEYFDIVGSDIDHYIMNKVTV